MNALAEQAALVCALLGLLSAGVVLARGLGLSLAVGVLLDFLLAAGLLRLGGDPSAQALLAAAAIVTLRLLLGFGLRAAPARDRP